MKNQTGISFALGAIIGAGITWLFTSKEGKEMLKQVKKKSEDLGEEIRSRISSMQNEESEENG
jgi:gas vesicle protein